MAVELLAHADESTGAASCDKEEWFAINWQTATLNVRRLQVRIVKAVDGGNNWSFFGTVEQQVNIYGESEGEQAKTEHRVVRLFLATQVPIVRHPQIRCAANPYDLQWETYFEERDRLRMAATQAGRRKLSYLWRQQGGISPICTRAITRLSGWNLHYTVWRTLGGADGARYRQLVHPACHKQAHKHGFSVEIPGPARGLRNA